MGPTGPIGLKGDRGNPGPSGKVCLVHSGFFQRFPFLRQVNQESLAVQGSQVLLVLLALKVTEEKRVQRVHPVTRVSEGT